MQIEKKIDFDSNLTYRFDTLKYKQSDSAGDSSSGDEQIKPDYYQLKRVKGSYCCFRPDTFVKGFDTV